MTTPITSRPRKEPRGFSIVSQKQGKLVVYLTESTKCVPGSECRLAVESSAKVEGLQEDVRYIRNKIDSLTYGVAGTVILLLCNFVWQLLTKGA